MGFKKQNSRKKTENGDFQVVGSLLYAHYYTKYFFLLFEQCYQVLCCVKIQQNKFESTNMGLAHLKILIFSDFSSMGVGLEKE